MNTVSPHLLAETNVLGTEDDETLIQSVPFRTETA